MRSTKTTLGRHAGPAPRRSGKDVGVRPNRGFTIVELVLVIVLTGILAAVAIPRFAGTSAFLERGYFDELLQATRYAHKLAVATHCQVRITITNSQYAIEHPNSAAECSGAVTTWDPAVRPDGKGSFQADVPDNVAVAPANTVITFSADGTATANPGDTVTVGSRSLRVWPATGYVERQ